MRRARTVFDNLGKFENATALLSSEGQSWTYNDLLREAHRFENPKYLNRLVFFFTSYDLISIAAYVGLTRAGAKLMLLSPDTSPQSLQKLELAYRPDFIWDSTSANLDVKNISGSESVEINPELSLLLTTSGSTGSPKFVRLSYENVISNTNSIVSDLAINSQDVAITTLPMNYSFGLSIINTHLAAGATLVLNKSSVIERDFWTLVHDNRVTTFGGVPYTYQMLSRLGESFLDDTSISYLTQAGGALQENLVEKFSTILNGIGGNFIVMYGQTEATARMSIAKSLDLSKSFRTIGKPISGGKFALSHNDGKLIKAPNTVGELIYFGDNVSLGYAHSFNDLQLGDLNHSILHTGDLAYFDDNGLFYITGRNNRFIKIFGNRVNLDEVQDFLFELGLDAACVGADDTLVVYITDSSKSEYVHNEVSTFLQLHRSATKVKIVESLPRNASGKLEYAKLN
jgi:acyl-CoA synthetase (AMP-forming)/AMP-acid ligase II